MPAPKRRHSDRGWRRFIRDNAYRDVWNVINSALLLAALWAFHGQQDDFRAEQVSRRSQTCTVFERLHQTDVRQLSGTYDYLGKLPPADLNSNLTKAIVASLPALEKRVKGGAPPAYCSKPGVGLDDNKLEKPPKRPPGLPPSQ